MIGEGRSGDGTVAGGTNIDAVEGFPNDARIARRRGPVWFSWSNNHGGKARTATVDEPFAGVVVDQELGHRLCRAVPVSMDHIS